MAFRLAFSPLSFAQQMRLVLCFFGVPIQAVNARLFVCWTTGWLRTIGFIAGTGGRQPALARSFIWLW